MINQIFFASDFIEKLDYEVVSFTVLDSECDAYSFQKFFGISTDQFINDNNITRNFHNAFIEKLRKTDKWKNVYGLGPTPIPSKEFYFYRLNEQPDIDLAVSVGLGVVKILRGTYKGEYWLYNWTDAEEVINADALLIDVYVQLKYPFFINKRLERFFRYNSDFIATYMTDVDLLEELKCIFNANQNYKLLF